MFMVSFFREKYASGVTYRYENSIEGNKAQVEPWGSNKAAGQ